MPIIQLCSRAPNILQPGKRPESGKSEDAEEAVYFGGGRARGLSRLRLPTPGRDGTGGEGEGLIPSCRAPGGERATRTDRPNNAPASSRGNVPAETRPDGVP